MMLRTLALAVVLALLGPEAMAAEGAPVPWAKIGFHAVNLTILVLILFFAARKPVGDALANRSANIKRDMDEINQLRKESQDRFNEIEAKLEGYEERLAAMKAEAEQEAEAEAQEIAARAERDAEQVKQAAERTIRDETLRARYALRRESVALAVKLAEEQLKGQITGDDQERFAGSFLSVVESEGNGVDHG